MIRLKNVTKVYPPDVIAVRNASLHIKSGEFVSIVGQSGTGKTTLIRLLLAEERPSRGQIILGDWDITHIADEEVPILRRQMGTIFQDFKLLRQKTVFENIAFALEVCSAPVKRIETIVPQVIKVVGLEHKALKYPHQLSGGEQQRVAVARALVHRPKILLADEPTGNLDAINARSIIDLLQKINEFGTTILLVTHNKEVVNALRRRVITLERGMVVSDQEEGKYLL